MSETKVIETKTDGAKGFVVIEGPTQESVVNAAAKQMVISAASAAGISRAGLSDLPPPYPVNDKGETNDDVIFCRNGQKVVAYRCRYSVMGAL